MARKHKYRHHKRNFLSSMIKKAAGVSGTVVMALPAIAPILNAGQKLATGGGLIDSLEAGTQTIGFSYKTGNLDMARVTKFGMFTGICLAAGYVIKKVIAKHV
jgi:hypothetical protein